MPALLAFLGQLTPATLMLRRRRATRLAPTVARPDAASLEWTCEGGGWLSIIAIPEALREKLGPDRARALADLLNEASVQTRGEVNEIAANRFQRGPAEETSGFGLADDFAALRAQMRAIERRLLRLMFVLWIAQIAAQAAILFAFFRP